MKLLIATLLVVSAFSAHAIQNTFKFTVLSSGPDMYACNAGIKHKDHNGSAGWEAGNSETETTNPGQWLQDVMIYSTSSFDQWTNTATPIVTEAKKRANGTNSFNSIFGNAMRSGNFNFHRNANDEAIVLTDLTFELSSERYGSAYFVDICYYGPRFHSGPVGTHFTATAELMMTNTYDKTYIEKAGLEAKAILKCDGQTVRSTVFTPVADANLKVFWNQVNIGSHAKDKCVTRFMIRETSRAQRVNQEHGAEAIVRNEIVDPVM